MSVEAPAVRVPREEGEEVRQRLVDAGVLRGDLRVGRDGTHLLFPLTGSDPPLELEHPVVSGSFEERGTGPDSYRDLLTHLPPDLREVLPTSFDIVGRVLIVKLPEALDAVREEVAEALLAANPVDTVAVDRGVRGELRVRDLEVVAGDPETTTLHREHGVRLRVDPARVYFSPRLATERKRVTDQVTPGEVVVDLFAGVGPFAVMMARLAEPARVVAVDLNPEAVELLAENIALNDVGDVVEAVEGDAAEVARELGRVADRVIMNLPHGAEAYWEDALALARPGATVHLHVIAEPEEVDDLVEDLVERAEAVGHRVEVARRRVVRAYSQWEEHVALDLVVDG